MKDKRITVTWRQVSMKQKMQGQRMNEIRGTGTNGGVLEM